MFLLCILTTERDNFGNRRSIHVKDSTDTDA